jgi:hypothetical protein
MWQERIEVALDPLHLVQLPEATRPDLSLCIHESLCFFNGRLGALKQRIVGLTRRRRRGPVLLVRVLLDCRQGIKPIRLIENFLAVAEQRDLSGNCSDLLCLLAVVSSFVLHLSSRCWRE